MLIFIFLAMNVKYCLTINPVMWFRFMGEGFNILPAWHVDQSVKYSARSPDGFSLSGGSRYPSSST